MRPREADTLPGLLEETGDPDHVALIHGDAAVTFGALADRAARVAGGLKERGVKAGDRVALWLPNRPEWLELHFALARIGATTVAVNTRFRAHEVRDLLERTQPKALAFAPGFKGIAFEEIAGDTDATLLRVGEDDLEGDPAPDASTPDARAIVFTSSGTTGRPKLVVHAQRGIAGHARAVAHAFGYDRPGCTVLGLLPLCGVFGYDSALGALAGGATVVLQEAFDADEAARLVERHEVTHANGSDTMLLRLFEARPDPPLPHAGFAAFDTDPRRVVDAGDEAGTTAYMCYGSTEVQALLTHAPEDGSPERRAIAGGAPPPGTDVRTNADGELEVRGPSVAVGDGLDFTGDGYLRTGDLGRITDDGFAFEGRRGDTLRLGGFLVSPREIEAFLEQGDDIAQAAVVAVEHEGAQRPVAFVVGDHPDADAARERCRKQLAKFKVPLRVIELDELPVTESANGRKVRRAELRHRATEALQPTTTE